MSKFRLVLVGLCLYIGTCGVTAAAEAAPKVITARPTATGTGGAAATIDATATQAAIDVLRRGGNAVDATVTAAAVLGVTEPFSCGIGGGGFMVIYRADDRSVRTIDSREIAPAAFRPDIFLDPISHQPIPFAEAVTSGLSVGVPGTPRGWDEALGRYGTYSLAKALKPATKVAKKGFLIDVPFFNQVAQNADRFRAFTSTRKLYFQRDGTPRPVGSLLRNSDLGRSYDLMANHGIKAFYDGPIARAIAETAQRPPIVPDTSLKIRPGVLQYSDLVDYEARVRKPTKVSYRGLDIYGMGPPSSGGSTVGEALNILEGYDLGGLSRPAAFHRMLEASRLAFADRNAYLGDPEFFPVPLRGLLSDEFAASRRSLIDPGAAGMSPAPVGNPYGFQNDPSAVGSGPSQRVAVDRLGSTTHLTVADDEGNVVAYTFTIEQIGGNGMVVPGYGFLLNNELTDFDFVPPHPNAPEAGKRPRSSMSPTIVLHNERPVLALGSPGGSTIITTALQLLVDRLDLRSSLPAAIAAPRASQRNLATTTAEPDFISSPEGQTLKTQFGHSFAVTPEIGSVAAIEFLARGRFLAAAEPRRRGGGSAAVVAERGGGD